MRSPHLSASILNADFARLGAGVERATAAGVDSVHLDVMDGHFVDNISFGAPVVAALRPRTTLPFHAHLMVDHPLAFVDGFVGAGSDLIVCHVEAADDPNAVIAAIHAGGRQAGVALNPDTPAEAVHPFLEHVELLLVMTVEPGFGGQVFRADVLPKLASIRAEADRRALDLPIGVDGGVGLDTIGRSFAAGGDVLVTGTSLYSQAGELTSVVQAFRAAARAGATA